MSVVMAARRVEALEAHAAEIRASGGKALAVGCDVSRQADCERLISTAMGEFGSVYAVFANAGYGVEGPVIESTDFDIRQIFETNFYGSLNVIRPALAEMMRAKAGHILFCSSCLSKIGTPYFASYSASKAAQDHYARAMRIELAASGISVSSVHPIGTRTEFFDTASTLSKNSRLALRTPERLMQRPEVVGKAVVKCLRRPKGEVWTSLSTRVALGAAVVFPGLADRVLRRLISRA
jgi:short-subunit dehydrogenase